MSAGGDLSLGMSWGVDSGVVTAEVVRMETQGGQESSWGLPLQYYRDRSKHQTMSGAVEQRRAGERGKRCGRKRVGAGRIGRKRYRGPKWLTPDLDGDEKETEEQRVSSA